VLLLLHYNHYDFPSNIHFLLLTIPFLLSMTMHFLSFLKILQILYTKFLYPLHLYLVAIYLSNPFSLFSISDSFFSFFFYLKFLLILDIFYFRSIAKLVRRWVLDPWFLGSSLSTPVPPPSLCEIGRMVRQYAVNVCNFFAI
jgi:hypothetical protein